MILGGAILDISISLLLVVHVVVSLLMILVILMQRPKQEGLGAAFGSGITDSAFGAGTTDVLKKATAWFGTTFLVLSLVLAILIGQKRVSAIEAPETPSMVSEEPIQEAPPIDDIIPIPAPPQRGDDKNVLPGGLPPEGSPGETDSNLPVDKTADPETAPGEEAEDAGKTEDATEPGPATEGESPPAEPNEESPPAEGEASPDEEGSPEDGTSAGSGTAGAFIGANDENQPGEQAPPGEEDEPAEAEEPAGEDEAPAESGQDAPE